MNIQAKQKIVLMTFTMFFFIPLYISAANCIRVERSTCVSVGLCTHTKLPQTLLNRTRGEKDDFTINKVVAMQYAVIVQDITITDRHIVICTKKSTKMFVFHK